MLKIPRQFFQFTLYSVKATLTIQETYKLGITSSLCHHDTKLLKYYSWRTKTFSMCNFYRKFEWKSLN